MESLIFKPEAEEKVRYEQGLQAHADCFRACAALLETVAGLMHDTKKIDGQTHFDQLLVHLLTRHVIEAMDAISVLVAKSCCDPCKMHLRTSFEALLGLSHILEKDRERRALAYQVAAIHRRVAHLKRLEKFDPEYTPNELRLVVWPPAPLVQAEIAAQQATLTTPDYAPIEAEWQRLENAIEKGKGKRPKRYEEEFYPQWYQLFSSRSSVSQMARDFKYKLLYDFLYSPTSQFAHVGGVMDNAAQSATRAGKANVRQVRTPDSLHQWRDAATYVVMEVVRRISEEYLASFSKTFIDDQYAAKLKPKIDEMHLHPMQINWRER